MERRQISEMQMMSECYGVMNSNLEFGQRPYEKQETIKITHALQQKLTNEEVSIVCVLKSATFILLLTFN